MAMEHRFDRLARSVSGATTRRDALRRVGGGLVMGLLASIGLHAAAEQNTCNQCCVVACKNLDPPPRGHEFALCIQECHDTGVVGGILLCAPPFCEE
jgi:hypothetical protein